MLQDALVSRRYRQSRLGERHGPNEARGWRKIAWQPQHPASLSKAVEVDSRNVNRWYIVHVRLT